MKVLITEEQIRQRVVELGAELSQVYQGRPLTILGVLTGSVVLLADLIRATNVPLRVALISASSYGGTRTSPGALSVNSSLVPDLTGRHVVILDDIFDTGKTMVGLMEAVQEFGPEHALQLAQHALALGHLGAGGGPAPEVAPDQTAKAMYVLLMRIVFVFASCGYSRR